MKFNELGLDSALLESIEKMELWGEATFPFSTNRALAWADVVDKLQTGTGKTQPHLKFCQCFDPSKKAYKDLSSHQLVNLRFKHKLFSDATKFVYKLFDGADINRQIRQLKRNPQIVVRQVVY